MCVGDYEFILLLKYVRLQVIERLLLAHDRHYLNYTSDNASDMSLKMF